MLEVIGFTLEGCKVAQAAGADRIELCDNHYEGGTTPSGGFIRAARKLLQIQLYPIIRPRGGDFLFSEDEFEVMKTDVQTCRELECDGVVIGILDANGDVDKEKCRQLVSIAYPMGVTFHRAFDRVKDPFQALEDIINIGCERILTSGQKPTAEEGSALISRLVEQADERIIIMPGSGVRADNIATLARVTGATEFHSSARIFKKSEMHFHIAAMQENLESVSVNGDEVKAMIQSLQLVNKLH